MSAGAPGLDLRTALPRGLSAVEASAGTGKTYALTAMAVRGAVLDGVRTDQLLVVTFTRAAAAELRGRIREGLRDASEALRTLVVTGAVPEGLDDWLDALCRDGTAVPTSDEAQRRARAAAGALSTLDRATITTIHGFCQASLAQLGLRGAAAERRLTTDVQRLRRDVVRDRLLTLMARDPDVLRRSAASGEDARESPKGVEKRVDELVKHVLASSAQVAPLGTTSEPVADRTARFVDEVVAELRHRLEVEGELTFDELVRSLRATLEDEQRGDVAVRQLRARLRLVLVDEMQDTDADQWAIIHRAFLADPARLGDPADVVIVGDPKQSIYRFRGADIDAYLEASEDAGDQRRSLARNWRSSAPLLSALDVLLRGATFGSERIAYHRVEAGADVGTRVHGTGAPLEVRWLPRTLPTLTLSKDGTSVVAPSGDAHVLDDLAVRVVELLRDGRVLAGAQDAGAQDASAGVDVDTDGLRALLPRDIAVLVRKNKEAAAVVERLAALGVPAAQPKGGRVYATVAFEQWRLLLTALARLGDLDAVRALVVSWFVDLPIGAVDDERAVDALQLRCVVWRDLVAADGVMALLAALRSDVEVATALARAGERGLTDLEHLSELAHVALGARGVPAAVALRTLEELALASDRGEDDTDDPSVRRIGSDGDAVQVMTFHGAKGLEFSVVLLPFSNRPQNLQQPWVFRSAAGRVVDAGSAMKWVPTGGEGEHGVLDAAHATMAQRREAAIAEQAGDEARLLYVALTRARDRCIVWWWPLQRAESTQLGRLLFGERIDGVLVPDAAVPRLAELDDDTTARRLADLAAAGDGTIDVHRLGVPDIAPRYRPAEQQRGPLAVAQLERDVHEPDVWRWSFTGLLRSTPRGATADVHQVPEPTGSDEPDAPAAPAAPDAPSAGADVPATGPLLDLPGGTAFGVLVHEALEVVDLSAAPDELRARLFVELAARASGAAMDVDVERVAAGLVAALATPLEPLADGLRLRDVAPVDRIPELVFELTVGDTHGRVEVAALGAAVADALAADDPFRTAFATLGARVERARFAGWLTGVVDLALRLPDGRYVVADYKTNRLSDVDGRPAYDVATMHAAMLHGEYPLQGLLYLVGMHRMLARRLTGYDPDRHLGGAAFLFLRGMAGPDTPLRDGVRDGVSLWRPTAAAVLAADAVLCGGSSR